MFLLTLTGCILGGLAGLVMVPWQRWKFEMEGRQLEVRNYMFHEVIRIDGVKLPQTRIDGSLSSAIHGIELPDGQILYITIAQRGGFMPSCVARIGENTVFDSAAIENLGPVRARLPTRSTDGDAAGSPDHVPMTGEPADARWAAAGVLFAELQGDDRAAPASAALKTALCDALLRLEQTRQSAEAHVAIGGSPDELAPVVDRQEEAIEEILAMLRDLHLVASNHDLPVSALSKVEQTLLRLEAEREVADAHLRQVQAQDALSHDGS